MHNLPNGNAACKAAAGEDHDHPLVSGVQIELKLVDFSPERQIIHYTPPAGT